MQKSQFSTNLNQYFSAKRIHPQTLFLNFRYLVRFSFFPFRILYIYIFSVPLYPGPSLFVGGADSEYIPVSDHEEIR